MVDVHKISPGAKQFDLTAVPCASCRGGPLGLIKSVVLGPKYDGKYLHGIVREILGDTKVSQALQNIVIPTFDIKLLQPTVFSRSDVRARTNFFRKYTRKLRIFVLRRK
jgi:hypothetical protein